MRVFVTGATGFIGSAVVKDLIAAGHQVLGLSRSEAGDAALAAAGADVHRGTILDLDSLRAGAASCDGIIHTAFNHDFSTFAANCEDDRHAIEAMGSVLIGSDRPFVVSSGTGIAVAKPGRPAEESDPTLASQQMPRAASEEAARALADRGVRVSIMRLPQVHDTVKQGLVTFAIAIAREKGVSAYVGDGQQRWPAVHISDAAPLYRQALEKAAPYAVYHAVGEEGVRLRDIAEVVGRGLRMPVTSLTREKAQDHFGWMAFFAGHDAVASSTRTQEALDWHPQGRGLIEDLEEMRYFEN